MSEIETEQSYEAYSFDMSGIYQITFQSFNDDIGIYYYVPMRVEESRQRLTEGEEYDTLYRHVKNNLRAKVIYGMDRGLKSVIVVKL